jgi:hypothetical protein
MDHPDLETVRAACLALEGTSERESHGAPTFWVKKRTFANWVDDHHGDGRRALWLAALPGMQEMLIEQDPEVFFRPPYVGGRGWIGVRLDRGLPWDQVQRLIEEAWRAVRER